MRLFRRALLLPVISAFLSPASPAGQMPSGQVPRAPEPCKYEENCHCAVPGITIRWRAAYCMLLNETDDFEQAGVQSCLARPEPGSLAKMTACERNEYWKDQICRARHREDEVAVRACVKDPKMMPRIVEFGAGG